MIVPVMVDSQGICVTGNEFFWRGLVGSRFSAAVSLAESLGSKSSYIDWSDPLQ